MTADLSNNWMGDIFDSCLNLESQHIDEGHQTGIEEGKAAGLREGRSLGDTKGYEIGYEVGMYEGCVEGWRAQQAVDPCALSPRADAAVAALEQLLVCLPLRDPKDESMSGTLEAARGKFKTIVAILGTAAQYVPAPTRPGSKTAGPALDQQPSIQPGPDLDF